jgi:hypothetical protein
MNDQFALLQKLKSRRPPSRALLSDPPQHAIDHDVHSVLHAATDALHARRGVHKPRDHLHHALPHQPHPRLRDIRQHAAHREVPRAELVAVDEHGPLPLAPVHGQVPPVLQVRAPPPEQHGDGARHQAVEQRPPREAVPARLQAEPGAHEELHDERVVLDAPALGAVQRAAGPSRLALLQQQRAEVALDGRPRRAGEGEEPGARAPRDVPLPRAHVGGGARVEPGRVRDADVHAVPGVALDDEAGDVGHPGHGEEAAAPPGVRRAAEVPRDAAKRDEVVPAVGPPVPRLRVEPRQQRDAVPVPVSAGGVGRPQVAAHGEPRVEWHEERRGAPRVRRAATVGEQAAVHDVLQRELVGRVPRPEQLPRQERRQVGPARREPESVVGKVGAQRVHRRQRVAHPEQVLVEGLGEVVNVHEAATAARIVLVSARRHRRQHRHGGGGGGGWGRRGAHCAEGDEDEELKGEEGEQEEHDEPRATGCRIWMLGANQCHEGGESIQSLTRGSGIARQRECRFG